MAGGYAGNKKVDGSECLCFSPLERFIVTLGSRPPLSNLDALRAERWYRAFQIFSRADLILHSTECDREIYEDYAGKLSDIHVRVKIFDKGGVF